MTRQGYIRQQKILQNRLMRRFLPSIYSALQKQVLDLAARVKTDGVQAALDWLRAEYHQNPYIGDAVEALYRTAARQAGLQLEVSKATVIPIRGFVTDVLKYFRSYLLEKVVLPISKSMVRQIEQVLRQAVLEGWGIDETVARLRDSEITKRRAKTIVRTETIRAMNYSQLVQADKSRFEMEKQWIAVEDKRTRYAHTHAGVDGQRRDLWEPFSNGLMCPGDPEGPPEQTINCRCTLGYHPKQDVNGLPIRKQPQAATG